MTIVFLFSNCSHKFDIGEIVIINALGTEGQVTLSYESENPTRYTIVYKNVFGEYVENDFKEFQLTKIKSVPLKK